MSMRHSLGRLLLALMIPASAHAQLGGLARRAAAAAERAAAKAVDCAIGDTRCVEQAEKDGKTVVIRDSQGNVVTNASGQPVQSQSEAANVTAAPGTGVWRNYDFTPGDSVWVAQDWGIERVGRFPASQLEFVTGNAEIVERDSIRLLEIRNNTTFRIKLPATLPDKFTIEFTYEVPTTGHIIRMQFADGSPGEAADNVLLWYNPGVFHQGRTVRSSTPLHNAATKKLLDAKLQVDSAYAILYVGSDRVAQLPNANFPRNNYLVFNITADDSYRAYLGPVVVRVGLDPLYDNLVKTGSVTTYGFLFDVGSERLRPESSPKLEELRKLLADHSDLNVMIEGHTDATGNDASNMTLSERRAQSVVAWLTSNGINATRLQASGKGETVPVADNANEAGRQQNRRVVIRKL
jgi:OOP family OmpA-OmpF porin